MNLLYSTTAPLAVFAVSVFYLVSVIHIVFILVVVMVITIVSNLTMITTWASQSPLTTIYPMCANQDDSSHPGAGLPVHLPHVC